MWSAEVNRGGCYSLWFVFCCCCCCSMNSTFDNSCLFFFSSSSSLLHLISFFIERVEPTAFSTCYSHNVRHYCCSRPPSLPLLSCVNIFVGLFLPSFIRFAPSVYPLISGAIRVHMMHTHSSVIEYNKDGIPLLYPVRVSQPKPQYMRRMNSKTFNWNELL